RQLWDLPKRKAGEGNRNVISLHFRNNPHPLITVLENRPDCWPVLLQQITVFFHQCPESSCVAIMAPFLRYLYCEPSQLREYAELRMGLLRILLQPRGPKHKEAPCVLEHRILQLLCDLIPHLQVNLLQWVVTFNSGDSNCGSPLLVQICTSTACRPLFIAGENAELTVVTMLKNSFIAEDFLYQIVLLYSISVVLSMEINRQHYYALSYKLFSSSENISATALVLVMPLLQILSSSSVGDCLQEDDSGTTRQQLATDLLEILKEEDVKNKKELMSCKLLFPITSSYCSLYTTWKILKLMKEKSAVTDWLSSVRSLLPVTTQVPAHIFLLLAYLLIQEKGDSLRDVLQTTTEIAKADCKLLQMFLGAICFTINYKDRIYPELQKFLATSDVPSLSVDKDAQWEKVIAKAACIRDICKQRPYQHGADMLAAISQVLNECTKPDQASPAAIVLQGLQALCEAEVVCINSTWNALSPKLSCDTRPLILKALNELFALVPSLTVNTNEYEVCTPDYTESLLSLYYCI
uniref:DUF3730 domain-containing protein n=1 Tax=Pavo cristatus TaxID=9049 RepID=A0A8C9L1U1_PAVCR